MDGSSAGNGVFLDGTFMPAQSHGSDAARLMMDAMDAMASTTVFVAGQEVDQNSAALAASGSRSQWLKQRQRALARHISSSSISSPADYADYYEYEHAKATGQNRLDDNRMPRPTNALTMPLGELALCYFAANFMLQPHARSSPGYFQYIPLLLPTQTSDSSLMYALRACAFAALGNRWMSDSTDFNAIALSQYTVALAKTTAALKDPQQSSADATLATVLLLGSFESLTSRTDTVAWRSHVGGAAHIVRQREQRRGSRVQTELERLLFNAVRMQMIAHILSANKPPSTGVNWWIDDPFTDAVVLRAQRLSLETSHLRLEFNRQIMTCLCHRPEDLAAMRTLLLRVQAIDNEIAMCLATMPEKYRYHHVAVVGEVPNGDYMNADAFPGRIDIYPDLSAAYAWNTSRVCRLVLSSLIIRAIAFLHAPADYTKTPEYVATTRACSRIVSDMVASIPFYLGSKLLTRLHHQQYYLCKTGSDSSKIGYGEQNRPNMSDVPKILSGMLLIWPLVGSHGHDCATKAQRSFVEGRLTHIADSLGLRYARVYSTTLFRYPSMLVARDRMLMQEAGGLAPDNECVLSKSPLGISSIIGLPK